MITDESIPDAVYVKGNLATDSAGDRSTVFIDGHGSTGETISIEAAAAATRIEPRLRDRRMAVKRAAGRKRIKWALIATVVVAVVVGGLAVLGSSLFAVEDVEVEGAVYTDERALAAVVDDLEGTPVLRVDTDAAERELEAIPWVESARVTTDFPDRVKIEIRERTPAVAYQGADDRYRVLDAEGRVLDVLDGQPVEYLQLTSAEQPSLAAGQFAPRGFAAAASLVQAMTPQMARRAESVAVAPDGGDLRLAAPRRHRGPVRRRRGSRGQARPPPDRPRRPCRPTALGHRRVHQRGDDSMRGRGCRAAPSSLGMHAFVAPTCEDERDFAVSTGYPVAGDPSRDGLPPSG